MTLMTSIEPIKNQANKPDFLHYENGANEETLTLDLFLGKEAL